MNHGGDRSQRAVAAVFFVSGRVAGWICCAGDGPVFSSFGIKTPFRGSVGHTIAVSAGVFLLFPKYTPGPLWRLLGGDLFRGRNRPRHKQKKPPRLRAGSVAGIALCLGGWFAVEKGLVTGFCGLVVDA